MADLRPSRAALREWLKVEGRTQAVLAEAIEVSQQTISSLASGRILSPSRDLAKLIEIATGIDADGWFTPSERKAWGRRVSRAQALRARP